MKRLLGAPHPRRHAPFVMPRLAAVALSIVLLPALGESGSLRRPSAVLNAASRRFASIAQGSTSKGVSENEAPSLLQLTEEMRETIATGGPLYIVNVNFDWQNLDPTKGVTMVVDKTSRMLRLDSGLNVADGIAWAHLHDNLDKTGWEELYLETTDLPSVSNDVKMFSAGFVEGMLTYARISQFYSNFYQTMMKDENVAAALINIRAVFADELKFLKTNINFHGGAVSLEPADPVWKHARYLLMQMWGIKDAYNFAALTKGVNSIDLIDMFVINSHGELPEMLEAYSPAAIKSRQRFQTLAAMPAAMLQFGFKSGQVASPHLPASRDHRDGQNTTRALRGSHDDEAHHAKGLSPPPANATEDEEWLSGLTDHDWEMRIAKRGHCSALVRVTAENADIMVGHTTWSDYSKMTRIFKYYNLRLPGSFAATTLMGFSSYPGCVSSTDDYYMLDSGLVVMDTSLEILNPKLYDRMPEFPSNSHIPNFMYVMVCNRMARTGTEWTSLFMERNSGTNNAQWLILDYNRFTPGGTLADSTLWLIEQIPGMKKKQDMTGTLGSNGYVASYNRPYFTETRRMSGHTAAEAKYGALYSYAGGPRASIFKNIAPAAKYLIDMRGIMNRNTYPNEGVLPNEPGHAISARFDLSFAKIPNGGIDAKITNRCLFRSLQCQAISGPSHTNEPVFKWRDGGADLFGGWPHLGLPDVWNFDWVQMTPSDTLVKIVDIDNSQCE